MKQAIGVLLALAISPVALANDVNLAQCQGDPKSQACLDYLEGTVDGALAVGAIMNSPKLAADSYAERALKYRSGRRFKQANDAYCKQRLPERDQMVLALDELSEQGLLTTQEELQQALAALFYCAPGQ
ncbi:hypothetical protein [Ferrimonas balearica]|uniref:hypothetical protein n=1 Tax=Ferrimonas balearica TaxID=44012 RepID=UPI001C99AD47|nr:hypothetical protein [Ferrimonas balearica]MBY5993498.1 hypothetical protein [Ferrimonas balearica]